MPDMKIRTDFVTNSSSSSFIIQLEVQTDDDVKLSIERQEMTGDGYMDCSFALRDSAGNMIESAELIPLQQFASEMSMDEEWVDAMQSASDSLNGVDLKQIFDLNDSEGILDAIKELFALRMNDDYMDSEDDLLERLEDYLRSFNDELDDTMRKTVSGTASPKDTTLTMEFSGMGEMLLSAEEILEKVFGKREMRRMKSVLEKEGSDDNTAQLRTIASLKCFTDESLKALADFFENCEDTPECCKIVQKLLPDGRISMSFDWQ